MRKTGVPAAAVALALLVASLLGASAAAAAPVVNGDFDSGLEGWQVYQSNAGVRWAVLTATEGPAAPPLSGEHEAITEGTAPGTTILYQNVSLIPNSTNLLQMTLRYYSQSPIVIPRPDSLFAEGPDENQQFRVDVMKPEAPLESLSPNDILATVFATSESENVVPAGKEPAEAEPAMAPRRFTVDLAPFAGQTVRLRFAVAASEPLFEAGVDAVSITGSPAPPPAAPPTPSPFLDLSNRVQKGKLTLNRENGTGSLAVRVPGPGTLTVIDGNAKVAIASMVGASPHKPTLIKATTLHPAAAEWLDLPFRPTKAGRRVLRETGKLKFRSRLTYTPDGGTAGTQIYKARLVETLRPKR